MDMIKIVLPAHPRYSDEAAAAAIRRAYPDISFYISRGHCTDKAQIIVFDADAALADKVIAHIMDLLENVWREEEKTK